MALSPEDIAMLKEAGLVNEAAEAHYEALKARGAARAARQQTVRAARQRRAIQARETLLRSRIEKVVRETLARPEFAESLDELTQAAAPSTTAPSAPDKPLHEMTAEEWRAHTQGSWEARMPKLRRPQTIGELIADGYGGDEA